ncbi:MAG: oligosaccharyl transferase, archaeosortase A system-associated [Dehalococcoidales bacterium]
MSESRFSSRWLIVILLLVIFGVALYIRVAPIYNNIFVGDNVKYASNDAYYFLRQADNLVHHFPHFSSFDPYLNYPYGLQTGSMNFFVYLLGGIAWLFGLGSPSTHLLDVISAYLPAFFGALTVIPLYFIGRALFNRGVGIIAAALIAILPGELLGRTLLGLTDRDSLEILLTTLTMMFIILAVKSAREKQPTFRRLNRQNLPVYTKPIIYSLLSGIFLGLSILTWRGSFLFVIVFLALFVIQSIFDYAEDESFGYISFAGIITFLTALLIVGVVSRSQIYSGALAISLFIPLALSGLSWLLRRWKAKSFSYFLTVVGIGAICIGIFYAASPSLFRSVLDQFSVFVPSRATLTTTEMGSILFPGGLFTLTVIWNNYTTSVFLSLIALIVLIYLYFRRSRAEDLFILVWGMIMLWATLDIRRIAPFFAVTVALLTGYLSVILYYVFQFALNYVTGRSNNDVSSRLLEFLSLKGQAAAKPLVEASPQVDYYNTLGVPRDATRKQIKKAHARLVFKYQTSGSLTDESRERLRQIDRAYSILVDFQKRAAYDGSEYDAAAQEKSKPRTSKRGEFRLANGVNIAIAGLAIFFLVLFPNFKPAAGTIEQTKTFIPNDAWLSSMVWLKDNTPEPFGDANFYYDLCQTPFNYPETAYGVTAWWDFGYWILRIGHRIPNCDPGAGARESVARLLISQNETAANELANILNSKYVIVDDATVTEMVYAITTYAGTTSEQFFDMYFILGNDGKLRPVVYYYPQYYQSLAVRLYIFNGNEIVPDSIDVISYVEKVNNDGTRYKQVTGDKTFNSYKEATDYLAKQTTGNYRIVNASPFVSSVPLERLEHYKLVYSSNQSSLVYLEKNVPALKIFERID